MQAQLEWQGTGAVDVFFYGPVLSVVRTGLLLTVSRREEGQCFAETRDELDANGMVWITPPSVKVNRNEKIRA